MRHYCMLKFFLFSLVCYGFLMVFIAFVTVIHEVIHEVFEEDFEEFDLAIVGYIVGICALIFSIPLVCANLIKLFSIVYVWFWGGASWF